MKSAKKMVSSGVMRRSTTALVRGFALAAAFCVLGGAGGCGRETFDLLPLAGAAGALSGASGGPAGGHGGAVSGAGGSLGGSFEAGSGGHWQASAGSAGRRNEGGMGGGFPCSNGAGCASGSGGGCPTSLPFCSSCTTDNDCVGEASHCDQDKGRCYECKDDGDCPPGQACNVFSGSCVRYCKEQSDCNNSPDHRLCRRDIGICVSCAYSTDCGFYNNGGVNKQKVCFIGECVECTENSDCVSNDCVAGECQKPH